MKEILEVIRNNSLMMLTTIVDEYPISRPFSIKKANEDYLYVVTLNNSTVCKHIKKNNHVGLAVLTDEYNYLRITGNADFSNDLLINEEIISKLEHPEKAYQVIKIYIRSVEYKDASGRILLTK